MDIPRSELTILRRKLNRRMMKTIKSFDLLQPNDRIMVAVSGGKDSYTLLDLMWRARKRSAFPFDIVAVHLDQKQPGYNGEPLAKWLENSHPGPYEILERDTYSIVLGLTKPGGTYCAPCSRLRRGILYDAAERLGCNKIALGHHRDDALETLMMNMFFSGKLQAMPATYKTVDARFDVIRPLIECPEDEIAKYSTLRKFPILPCNLCGSQSGLQREKMGELLCHLEKDIPNVREVMLAALRNVVPTHLLDPKLLVHSQPKAQIDEPLIGDCGDLTSDGADTDSLIQIHG